MTFSLFHAIGARLNSVLVIFIIGFGIIGASASIFFGQMEREYEKRQVLFDQEQRLNSLRSHILTSVVLLDDVLFKSNASAISKMLAVNEDTLSAFAAFQASAEVNELLNDVHLAREIEPVVYRLRNDFYTAVSLFRKGQIERAKEAREDALAIRLKIVNAFIDNSHALREFDITDQNKLIISLRNKIITWSLLILVFTASICFLVLLFAGRSITRPVAVLMRSMDAFSADKYETGVALDVGKLGNNEIGILGGTFKKMAADIQQNINEREQIQIDLKNSQDRTETIMSNIADGIVVCGKDGTIESANRIAADIFDAHMPDMIGKSLDSLLAGEDVTAVSKADIKPGILAETGQISEFERVKSNHVTIWVEVAATSLELGEEEILIVSFRDITEHKVAEASLIQDKEAAEAAEELFSKAYRSSPALFTISSPEDGRHIEVNDAWSIVTGYSRAEAMQKTASELGIWANPDQREEFVEQMNNQGFVRNYEMVLRTKLGVEKDMIYSGDAIEFRGENCLLIVGQDISERVKLDRMKSEFVSTVSHELRTPLTSIKGSLGLITGGALGEMPKEMGRMVNLAESNTTRLINLVNDLLDMEKLQSGQLGFHMEKASLTEIIATSIEANLPYAEEHKVFFKLTGAVPDALVSGDRERLAQVLGNLLSNAAKFSPEGETVEISLTRSGGAFRVSVSDCGPGIPDEFRERLFERFTQADSTDARQKGGTGLGLNISRAIVEKHGGVIGFESVPGEGATFYFDLPEYGIEVPASPAPAASDVGADKPKVIDGQI